MPGELAEAMGCSRPVIDKALRNGMIPHVRLGHRIFIPRRIAVEILENGRIPQPPAASAGIGVTRLMSMEASRG
jgi:excisionase family DNA binding protein